MKKGFTLIELLVVVLIIGILAAVALPQYQKAVDKTRFAEVMTTMNSMEKSIQLYLLANGYPSSTIYFTGKNATASLDVDSKLDCSDNTYNTFCYSKYFRYETVCYSSSCRILVDRIDENKSLQYYLQLYVYLQRSSDAYCNPMMSKEGEYICKYFLSQR